MTQPLSGTRRSDEKCLGVFMRKKNAHIVEVQEETVTVPGKARGSYADRRTSFEFGEIRYKAFEIHVRSQFEPPFFSARPSSYPSVAVTSTAGTRVLIPSSPAHRT